MRVLLAKIVPPSDIEKLNTAFEMALPSLHY
jgi:hypothetical protein